VEEVISHGFSSIVSLTCSDTKKATPTTAIITTIIKINTGAKPF